MNQNYTTNQGVVPQWQQNGYNVNGAGAGNSSAGTSGVSDGGNLLGGLVNAGIGYATSLPASTQYENAANASKYPNSSISTLGGTSTGQAGPNGYQYSQSSPLQGNFNQFANIAGASGQNALTGLQGGGPSGQLGAQGQAYLNSGNGVLSAFNNFNPQQFAQQQYNNLSALAAPGQTDQTQQMLNYEQASGRGGVTQNGQLGDLGGLNLSQQLADQNRQLQAQQLATQQQSNLGQLASGLSGTGSSLVGAGQGYNTNSINQAYQGIQGTSNINSQLLGLLQTQMGGQSQAAQAGANSGYYQSQLGQNQSNALGNVLGGINQGISNSGGTGGLYGAASNFFSGLGGNNSSNFQTDPSINQTAYNFGDNYTPPPIDTSGTGN